MSESSRCLKYGGVHETVPRHECSLTSDEVDCEFDFPAQIRAEIAMWRDLGLSDLAEKAERKLKFSLERASGLDKNA